MLQEAIANLQADFILKKKIIAFKTAKKRSKLTVGVVERAKEIRKNLK
jgi:hypothetical protein